MAIDWDDTLVGYKKYGEPKEWLPGAVDALRSLRRQGYSLVIHSCRAGWPEGREEIRAKLASIKLQESGRLQILGKPLAVAYIDDRGERFENDWPATLRSLRG